MQDVGDATHQAAAGNIEAGAADAARQGGVVVAVRDDGGVWKWIVGVLSSMMLTGLAAWWTFGGAVTAQEVREMMDREYQRPIEQQLLMIEKDLERLRVEQKVLAERTAKQHDETQEKLNQIIRQLPPERR